MKLSALDFLATVLNRCVHQHVTVQQARVLLLLIQTEKEGGMTIPEMAGELGIAPQSVRASLRLFMTNHLNQKIDDGAALSSGYVPVRWSLAPNGRALARQLFSVAQLKEGAK